MPLKCIHLLNESCKSCFYNVLDAIEVVHLRYTILTVYVKCFKPMNTKCMRGRGDKKYDMASMDVLYYLLKYGIGF